ncbi:MAG: toll/interleukin-1 receptor domain-containing protein [Hyphomonadaceae bacterium JAD_PAG50586_4]|nr:MAG: toll/interleukin-1 receptor domain-containing protein [Hyphomonadaceae bacterium JAD_PAG50586_4]
MADDIRVEVQRTGAQPGKRFAAFISYSHRDEEIGDWLHRRLEAYAVPSQLVGRTSSVGPIGKRLGKVFRDRADLSAAHDLGREIREGLEQSDALIVLCSPRSSGSKYVQEEICTFKKLGKGHRIFAAIIDGEPHAAGRPGYTAADECFPPALIYALGEDGALSSRLEPTEPIAADFREGKDGRENGALKIIAGLLDVGLDELVQRERQAERARRQRANLIAAAMAALALAAFGTGVFAWLKQNEAITNFQLAQDRAVAEAAARAQAEQNAREREEQRQNANIQRLAAIANAEEASAERDNARRTLHRIFVARAWEKFDASDYVGAAQYSLAGWRLSRDNNDASIDLTYRLVLGASMFRMGEIVSASGGAWANLGRRTVFCRWRTDRFRYRRRGAAVVARGRFDQRVGAQ